MGRGGVGSVQTLVRAVGQVGYRPGGGGSNNG